MSVPYDRLEARDLYRLLDRLREHWTNDEVRVTRRLQELRRLLATLPPEHAQAAVPHVSTLERARLVRDVDWRGALLLLRGIVAAWDRSRPSVLRCDVGGCGITRRGAAAIEAHRRQVHGLEAPQLG